MNDFLRDSFKREAKENKLTREQIKEIFYSQFKYVAHVMSADSEKEIDDIRSIKIKGLCTFAVNKKKLIVIKKLKKEKDARKNMDESSAKNGEGAGVN
jgi:isopentenyldiphosphate isomerase